MSITKRWMLLPCLLFAACGDNRGLSDAPTSPAVDAAALIDAAATSMDAPVVADGSGVPDSDIATPDASASTDDARLFDDAPSNSTDATAALPPDAAVAADAPPLDAAIVADALLPDAATDAEASNCGPGIIALDTFTESDGPLAGRAANTGQIWDGSFTTANVSDDAATWGFALLPTCATSPAFVQIEMTDVPSEINSGLYIDADLTISEAYLLGISDSSIGVYYFTPGTSYQAIAVADYTPQAGDVLKVSVDGTTIAGFVNGIQLVSGPMTIGVLPGGNYTGLYQAGTGGRIDNFEVGVPGAATTCPPGQTSNGPDSCAFVDHGTALNFSGGSEFAPAGYVDVPNNAGLEPSVITVSAWVNLDQQGQSYPGIACGGPVCSGFSDSCSGNSTHSRLKNSVDVATSPGAVADLDLGYGYNCTTPGNDPNPETYVATAEWHLVTMTFDGQHETVYQDNVQAIQLSSSGPATIDYTGAIHSVTDWYIGTFDPTFGPMHGSIDEVAIWNRALSSTEVNDLYNGGAGVFGTTSVAPFNSGLIAGYHFDEDSGTTVYDWSGNGNDGILVGTGMTWVTGNVQ